jgi:EAL domain-containing protein (putative c-di-GMP-specific phosphodiesterase class I)
MGRTSWSVRHAVSRRARTDFGPVHSVLQPIIDVADGTIVGAEALARFPESGIPVQDALTHAYRVGRGEQLEAECVQAGLALRAELDPPYFISINVSPDAISHPQLQQVLGGDLSGVVIEITEQAASEPLSALDTIADCRRRGARIAVDDVTTGYAGLTRLAALRPDIVKLDRTLVSGTRSQVERTAVIEALVSLTRRLGGLVLGEGVETLDELAALSRLDVDYGQGTVIAPPGLPLPPVPDEVVQACRAARRRLLLPGGASMDVSTQLHNVTATLAGSVAPEELAAILRSAADSLAVDVIGLSVLSDGADLREISATGAEADNTHYPLIEFPATGTALATGAIIEVHVDDVHSDPAERELLRQHGFASLLLVPLIARSARLGILELSDRDRRRWSAQDISQARLLADHVAQVLTRLAPS